MGTSTNLCLHKRFAHLNQSYLEYRAMESTKTSALEESLPLESAGEVLRFSQSSGAPKQGETGVSFHAELIKKNLTQLLKKAKNEIMVVTDLMDALIVDLRNSKHERKWFNRMVDNMVKTSYIERVNVPKRKDGIYTSGVERCVRLLKMYYPKGGGNVGASNPSRHKQEYRSKQMAADPDSEVVMGEGGLLADLPFEWQVYRLIALSGQRGVTAAVIQRSLNLVGTRLLTKTMTQVVKPADAPPHAVGASRVAEFVGRERRYRYYSSEAYNTMMGRSDQAAELGLLEHMLATDSGAPGTPTAEEERAVEQVEEGPARKKRKTTPPPRPKRKVRAVRRETPEPVVVPEPVESASEDVRPLGTTCSSCKIGQSSHTYCNQPPLDTIPEGDYFCSDECLAKGKSRTEEVQVVESDEDGDATFEPMQIDDEESESFHRQPEQTPIGSPASVSRKSNVGTPVPASSAAPTPGSRSYSTITGVRRRNLLLQLVQQRKVLEVGHLLVKAYRALEEEQYGKASTHLVDKKTLLRTAKEMEYDGLLKIHHVGIPQLQGKAALRMLLLDASLSPNDWQVKDYIEMMTDRQAIMGGIGKLAKVEVADMEVERLDELQQRLNIGRPTPAPPEPPATPTATIDVFRGTDQRHFTPYSKGRLSPEAGRSTLDLTQSATPSASTQEHHGTAPTDTPSKKTEADGERSWIVIAQQYGFVTAKMLRARYLHEWLVNNLLDEKDASERTPVSVSSGPYRNGGIFQTTVLFRDLPFDMYLRIIGQVQRSEVVDAFMQRPEYGDVKISDLPQAVRNVVFSKGRFRRMLKQSIDILMAVQILRPAATPAPHADFPMAALGKTVLADHMHVAYCLQPNVPLYDYVSAPDTLLGRYEMSSTASVQLYWFQFEFCCLRHRTSADRTWQTAEDHESDTDAMVIDQAQDVVDLSTDADDLGIGKPPISRPGYLSRNDEPLAMLNRARNWHTTFPYTAEQRNLLESHMNRASGTTPLRKDAVCHRLAQETGLTVARVKYYFSRAEDVYTKKVSSRHKAAETRKRTVERKRLDSSSATPAQRRRNRKNEDPTALKREERLNGRRSYRTGKGNGPSAGKGPVMDAASGLEELDGESVPVIADEERFQTQYNQVAKRRRVKFTADDDDVLLYGYAILNNRYGPGFPWQSLADVFDKRGFEIQHGARMTGMLRRRFSNLVKTAAQQERVNTMATQWTDIQTKGVAEGVFTEAECDELTPERLMRLIDYFIKTQAETLKETAVPGLLVHLPKTVEQLHAIFTVTERPNLNFTERANLEEELEGKPTIRSKMSVLYGRALTLLMPLETQLDQPDLAPPTPEQMKESIVISVIMTILMTPEARYDSARAFCILHAFSLDVVASALQVLQTNQSIAKVRSSMDRRVPGRGVVLSEKFLDTLAGTLPDRLLPQAIAYSEWLKTQLRNNEEGVTFNPFVNGGSMVPLLDAIAFRRARLELKFPNTAVPIARTNVLEIQRDVTKADCDVVLKLPEVVDGMSGEVTSGSTSDQRNAHVDGAGTIVTQAPGSSSYGETADAVLANAPIESGYDWSVMRKIYEIVVQAGEAGVSPSDLQRLLQSFGLKASCLSKYIQLFATTLRLNDIPLVVAVGFDQLRYVAHGFYRNWAVPLFPTPQTGELPVPTAFMAMANQPTTFMPARMWYDIHGDSVDTVKRACMETTLGTIVQKPGIYESKIHARLATIMTRVELAEILQLLVDRGACRRRIIVKNPPVRSIFDGLFGEGCDAPGYADSDDDTLDDRKISCYWPESEWYLKTII
ncbi:hypothetical protein DFJ77DRAFT_248496 [Powellomyces hirtus]|nr:hypothetical protein DFJ77DRAFT_248496 [Powellomyces hirtus]